MGEMIQTVGNLEKLCKVESIHEHFCSQYMHVVHIHTIASAIHIVFVPNETITQKYLKWPSIMISFHHSFHWHNTSRWVWYSCVPYSLAPPQHMTKTLEPENKGGYLLLPRIQLAVHIHLRVNFTLNSLFKTLQKQVGCFNHRVVTMVADNLWL